jgi:hypothetical protein
VTSYSYARERYARGGEDSTLLGGVILAIVATASAILVLLGLVYAAGDTGRHQIALANAGCEPNLSPAGLQCTTVWVLEGRWTALTTNAFGQLNTEAAAYNAAEFSNLASAKLAVTSELATARTLDATLATFPFPPDTVSRATALRMAILASVKVMDKQANASSLAQMRSFNAQLQADGAVIQKDVNNVHAILYIRPTAAQEPTGGSCGGVCPGQGVQPQGKTQPGA